MAQITLLLHAATTLAMTGLIWFVQVVHYPMFSRVGESQFTAYEVIHQRRTGWVVGPLMLLEIITAVAMIWIRPPQVSLPLVAVGLVLLVLIWLTTAFLSVPAHRQLESGFQSAAHRRLVSTNWIRTVAWTLRSGLVGGMIWQARANGGA